MVPFPVTVQAIFRYIAHLIHLGRTFGTILNHVSSIKHKHQFLGFELLWDKDYRYKLLLRGCKRLLGTATINRKLGITPEILLQIFPSLSLHQPLHSAMWCFWLPFIPFCISLI